MNSNVKISSMFPKYLFWDMNYESLDANKNIEIIIPRALYMTNKETFNSDIKKLESIYKTPQIIHHLQRTKERISNEVCELVAKRYNIPVFHRYSIK